MVLLYFKEGVSLLLLLSLCRRVGGSSWPDTNPIVTLWGCHPGLLLPSLLLLSPVPSVAALCHLSPLQDTFFFHFLLLEQLW